LLWVSSPGTKPSIQFRMEGANGYEVDSLSGELKIHSSLGSLIYKQAYAYEIDALGNLIPGSDFAMPYSMDSTGVIGLYSAGHNLSNGLVVVMEREEVQVQVGGGSDNLLWSSFYGGNGVTELTDVKNDANGNVYFCGSTQSVNFPVASGLNPPQLSGVIDGVVIKLNNDVEYVWTVFYGGRFDENGNDADEKLNSIDVSSNGDRVYVVGFSASADLPLIDGGGQYYTDGNTGNSGSLFNFQDGIIGRFDNNGMLEWSSYFGGMGRDGLYGVSLDDNNSVYVVGQRNSNSLLLNEGSYDSGNGLIAKFNADNEIEFSYAWKARVISSVACDDDNNFYITGWTRNNDMPVLNFDQSFNGGSTENYDEYDDALIAKFSSAGALGYSFYYGGSCNDRGFDIAVGADSKVYVAGVSMFDGPFPINCLVSQNLPTLNGFSFTGAAPPENPLPEVFVLKLDEHTSGDVSILNASYYGGGGSETNYADSSPNNADPTATGNVFKDVAIDVSDDGYVFISGTTSSTYDSFLTGNYPGIQMPINQPINFYINSDLNNTGAFPQRDAFIAAFNPDFNLVWATYFGGTNHDATYAISVSNSDNRLYLCGSTLSISPQNDFEFRDYDGPFSDVSHYQVYPNSGVFSFPSWTAMFSLNGIDITGINKIEKSAASAIYPNPVKDFITIESVQLINSIQFLDVIGQSVFIFQKVGSSKFIVDVGKLPSGIYLIKLISENQEVSTHRFIKH
jgi:hypothetical protein